MTKITLVKTFLSKESKFKAINNFRAMMKKVILLSVLMAVLVPISTICGKDDEMPNLETSIVGTWTVVDFERTNCTDNNNGTITSDCPTYCMTYTFYANGTLSNSYSDPNNTEAEEFLGVYTASGNNLTICNEDGVTDCEVTTIVLSSNNLSISFLEDNGIDSCDLTMNLTRN